MTQYQIRQLADELKPPETGKQSVVLVDNANTKTPHSIKALTPVVMLLTLHK